MIKKLPLFSALALSSVLMVWLIFSSRLEAEAARKPGEALGVQEYSKPIPAGDFTLPDSHGRQVSLKDFRGKTVMLNFWATWCGPCEEEMPSMERLHQKFKDRGLVVLGVAAGENREDVRAFMEDLKLTFPALVDSEDKVSQAYNVWSIPLTFFINAKGELIGKVHGSRQWDKEESIQYISSLLKKP